MDTDGVNITSNSVDGCEGVSQRADARGNYLIPSQMLAAYFDLKDFQMKQMHILFLSLLIFSACRLSENLTGSVTSIDNEVTQLSNIPMNKKIVRTQEENLPYAYAPNIVYHEGVYHALYCGSNKESGGDGIRYTFSTDDGNRWSKPQTIHYSTVKKKYHFQTCDPSVVYHPIDQKWYLYYSGSYRDDKGDAYKTLIFLARSNSIAGPYEIYTESGTWDLNKAAIPKAIIEPMDTSVDAKKYGAGQTTVYMGADFTIHIWFTDDSEGKPKIYKVNTLKNPYTISTRIDTGVEAASVDVKYDMDSGLFNMLYIKNEHRPGAHIVKRTSSDLGVTFSDEITVCGSDHCTPDYISNLGIAGDAYGNFQRTDDQLQLVGYGGPIDPMYSQSQEDTFADPSAYRWDLFISRINTQGSSCQPSISHPFMPFKEAYSHGKALLPPTNLIDASKITVYSSGPSADKNSMNPTAYEVWVANYEQLWPIKTIHVYPRKEENLAAGSDQILGFPQSYSIYVTNPSNTGWEHLGDFYTQPSIVSMHEYSGIAGYKRAFAATIDLPNIIWTHGILVKPMQLGRDDHGNPYFQLAEIEVETWRECK